MFTKEELNQIYYAATWSGETDSSESCMWVYDFNEIICHFENNRDGIFSMPSTNIYGGEKEFFLPLWNFAEDRITSVAGEMPSFFLEAVKKDFLSETQKYWAEIWRDIFNGYADKDDRKNLNDFVGSGHHYAECCKKYPVYARLSTEYIFTYIKNAIELYKRIENDKEDVYRKLYVKEKSDSAIPKVSQISCALSDRHNGGQAVYLISYEDGRKAVYKPRGAFAERILDEWLTFLCRMANVHPMAATGYLDKGDYAYFEFIEPYDFQDISEISDFFFLEGFLMGTFFIIQGGDIHAENLIAAKNPIIIDPEVMMVNCQGHKGNRYGIFSSLFIPFAKKDSGYKICGSASCYKKKGYNNLPVLNGQSYSAYDFPEEMINGFATVMNTFIDHRKECYEKLKEILCGAEIRTMISSTYIYEYTIRAFLVNEKLTLAEKVDEIINICIQRPVSPKAALFSNREEFEKAALQRMDIPVFYSKVTEDNIECLFDETRYITRKYLNESIKSIRFVLQKDLWKTGNIQKSYSEKVLLSNLLKVNKSRWGIVVDHKENIPTPAKYAEYYLEGILGVLVSLAIYHKERLNEIDESTRLKIEDILRVNLSYYDNDDFLAGCLSVKEPGIAEGMGSVLCGGYILYRFGYISSETLNAILNKAMTIISNALDLDRIFCLSGSFLYGINGLIFAMDEIGLNYTDEGVDMEHFKDICSYLKNMFNYPEDQADALLQKEIGDAKVQFDCVALSKASGYPMSGLFYGCGSRLIEKCGFSFFDLLRK